MASATTVQTALCLIPPESVWQQIQAIRSTSDKAYPRWMPHINFIYPFVPGSAFESIKAQLESVVHRHKPFVVQFDQSSLHYFQQGSGDCTYHLRPKDSTDIVALQADIQNQLLKICKKKRPFEAHLTLGQSKAADIDGVLAALKANWTPIEFTVDRVYLISREDHSEGLFEIKSEIPLLDQHDTSAASALPVKLMNYLCIMPPNGFTSQLLRALEHTSFLPAKTIRINLAEYENGPVSSELRANLESAVKCTLEFDHSSVGYDEATGNLFLRPTSLEALRKLNVLQDGKYDGSLTLGRLDKQDLDGVIERFTKNWPNAARGFEIDRIHLVDADERVKFMFRLKK